MPENDSHSGEILVALDGSPNARSAANTAVQIAQGLQRPIRGLYVVDEALALETYANYSLELGITEKPDSRVELVEWFEGQGDNAFRWLEARCLAAHVPMTASMIFGGVSDTILLEAASASLVALGRRGHGHAANGGYLGSHFQTVAHHIQIPLLTGGDMEQPLRRVLLAYDSGKRASKALAWASQIQRALKSDVIVLTTQDSPRTSAQGPLKVLAALQQSDLVNYRLLTHGGHAAASIMSVAADNEADLIIMGSYAHGALLEWLGGNTVDRVLRSTPLLPVLIA